MLISLKHSTVFTQTQILFLSLKSSPRCRRTHLIMCPQLCRILPRSWCLLTEPLCSSWTHLSTSFSLAFLTSVIKRRVMRYRLMRHNKRDRRSGPQILVASLSLAYYSHTISNIIVLVIYPTRFVAVRKNKLVSPLHLTTSLMSLWIFSNWK